MFSPLIRAQTLTLFHSMYSLIRSLIHLLHHSDVFMVALSLFTKSFFFLFTSCDLGHAPGFFPGADAFLSFIFYPWLQFVPVWHFYWNVRSTFTWLTSAHTNSLSLSNKSLKLSNDKTKMSLFSTKSTSTKTLSVLFIYPSHPHLVLRVCVSPHTHLSSPLNLTTVTLVFWCPPENPPHTLTCAKLCNEGHNRSSHHTCSALPSRSLKYVWCKML